VKGVFTAETAILLEFKTIGIVLLILSSVVVSLLAFCANECELYSHFCTPPGKYMCFTSLEMELSVTPIFGHNKKTLQQR